MAELEHHAVDAGGVSLNVYALGNPAAKPVIALHGMRDVALSLLPVAERLAQRYRVLLPDLRGHGRSDRPGSYAMPAYIFDLHRTVEHFQVTPVALLGPSLGGQIVARFAAMFPELVAAAIIVEGLGPPTRPTPATAGDALRMEGERLLATFGQAATSRPLPSVEFAAERLLANNPRLDRALALRLARQATERDAQGNLVWSFDPRVGSVFLSAGDSDRYWGAVRCPTLLVTGQHAGDYWSRAVPAGARWSGDFADGELEARLATFPDHEHQAFEHSGHMVHFDEPERLAAATDEFLRRRYD